MTLEETEELFSQLREAGYEPSICEDDIPTFLNPVHCGPATEIGDVILENDDWYSRDLIERHQKFKITAIGDSMQDAGFAGGLKKLPKNSRKLPKKHQKLPKN